MQVPLASVLLGATLLLPVPAAAQSDEAPDGAAAPEGIVPLPSYDGDLRTRSHLLGDLDGGRSDLAGNGVQFLVDWTQTVQGVVDGGRDETTRYGGALDYNLTLDLMRMGVMPGAVISVRAETRYGGSVNAAAGPLLPVNNDAFFPLSDEPDDDIDIALTTLSYTQYLSSTSALFLGKLDTLDGDPNEFASGRGMTQFQNGALVYNTVTALTTPYSTLAAGALWAPNPHVTIAATVMNAADASTNSGFDGFGEGWNLAMETQFQYRLGGLPGGQNVGGLYAADREFLRLGSRFVFTPGIGLNAPQADESWYVYWSGWQYLWTEAPAADGPMNLTDRRPDLQGFGLFARFGFADRDTNPVEWNASIGLGGRGIVPGRDDDLFGLGYYYSEVNLDRLAGAGLAEDHTDGFEAFYSFALAPSTALTVDLQVVDDLFAATDSAVILGARLGMRF